MNPLLDDPTYGKMTLLRVEAPHFVAGALWRQRPGQEWVCIFAAPILAWMRTKSAKDVGAYLKARGWAYQWIERKPGQGAGDSVTPAIDPKELNAMMSAR